MKCPICGSTKFKENINGKVCEKCGYENKARGKIICGGMYDNWWMTGK